MVAERAIERAASGLAACRKPRSLWGKGDVLVTFGLDGSPTDIVLGTPFRDTTTGACVRDMLLTTNMGEFEGPAPKVRFHFFLPEAIPK